MNKRARRALNEAGRFGLGFLAPFVAISVAEEKLDLSQFKSGIVGFCAAFSVGILLNFALELYAKSVKIVAYVLSFAIFLTPIVGATLYFWIRDVFGAGVIERVGVLDRPDGIAVLGFFVVAFPTQIMYCGVIIWLVSNIDKHGDFCLEKANRG